MNPKGFLGNLGIWIKVRKLKRGDNAGLTACGQASLSRGKNPFRDIMKVFPSQEPLQVFPVDHFLVPAYHGGSDSLNDARAIPESQKLPGTQAVGIPLGIPKKESAVIDAGGGE